MLLPLLAEGLLKFTGADISPAFALFLERYNHHEYEQLVINISLGVVVASIALAVVASMLFPAKENGQKAEAEAE